ncbi:energy transducer TonB [Polynucleobacter sp. AP-Latsch-80-C2]|jgi:protein TonB|uniref:energy transducer TonB n=1 Tax=Polynucleobacter sp. AP-Latsch-80-C2 TaxID=2576931 RepID=UPI001C0C1E5A|nr:energy transducer TonB [Polynucleobacter sp. AP-Latsch-80-C2]MBU3623413.1 energy transducer TonB [Polynucleobacter sp. AP-Latsch-80-C2]
MNAFLHKLDTHLPFNKTERIIIGIVLLLHALPALEFLHWTSKPTKTDDDARVMANLVSPDTANKSQQPPAPPPPKPKPEQKKKTVDEKSTEKPAPTQPQQQTQSAQTSPPNKSESTLPNASVAPATTGGASGTPIQTDIGKLVVVYQPDADAYYPSFSKRSGEQGDVVVKLIIDETGAVEEVAMLKSSTFPRLDRAATEIGKRYRFKPFLVNGSPARISTNLLIKFNLKN